MWTGSPPRSNLVETFIEYGLLTEIRKWISPLHDGCLPALPIRVKLLNLLTEVSVGLERPGPRHIGLNSLRWSSLQLPISDPYLLTHSGIRHAVGILLSHPDETRANKTLIRQLISESHTPPGDQELWWTTQKWELTAFSFLCPDKWVTELFGKSLEDRELWREKSMRRDVQPLSQPDRFLDQFTDCPLKN